MLWALDIRVFFLLVCMNDVSPYVACNEMRGLLFSEKWKKLLENFIICFLRYP
jgi:hypothetical protein